MRHPSVFFVVIALLLPQLSLADTSDGKVRGLEIATEADKRDSGWQFQSSDMEMILRNRAGKESRRKISSRQLEVEGDGDKTLSLFHEPRDVRGTAMLTFSHGLEPDDQWLYLPAIKRVKRISSRNRSGPFMGSAFAFEDLSSQELDKYDYRYLRDEPCGVYQCYVIERIPLYDNSGYTRQIVWLDQAEFRSIKIEYYDRKDELLKTLDFSDYQEYPGGYWRADKMEMTNHQTGKSTTLLWFNYDFETPLKSGDFNKNALKRLL